MGKIDPIHQDGLFWYFWDETWTDRLGPYQTEELAKIHLKKYIQYIETGVYDES